MLNTFKSLKLITDALEETKKERPDRDKIYQDDRWTVVVPKTHDAACNYGRHSNWCVSTSNSSYFGRYTKDRDALLFFILWRNKRNADDKTEYKVAINAKFRDWEDPQQWDWYDMPDHNMDPNLMLNVFPRTMIEKVQRYLVVEGKNEVILADTSVKLMMKLHQLYSGTIKFESGNSMVLDLTKAEFIKSQFATAKIGIFYKFKEELNALSQVFGAENLTTDLSVFESTDKNIALQIVSGREGISLKQADCLVYYNIDFSATSYWQSKDRMTTIDRKFNKVYWVFTIGGIEEKIYEVVQQKKDYTLNFFKKDFLNS